VIVKTIASINLTLVQGGQNEIILFEWLWIKRFLQIRSQSGSERNLYQNELSCVLLFIIEKHLFEHHGPKIILQPSDTFDAFTPPHFNTFSGNLSIPREAKGSVKECLISSVCLFVTSFSSNTSEARGPKIGMHNPYMDGSKFTDQIFDILPRSWDI